MPSSDCAAVNRMPCFYIQKTDSSVERDVSFCQCLMVWKSNPEIPPLTGIDSSIDIKRCKRPTKN